MAKEENTTYLVPLDAEEEEKNGPLELCSGTNDISVKSKSSGRMSCLQWAMIVSGGLCLVALVVGLSFGIPMVLYNYKLNNIQNTYHLDQPAVNQAISWISDGHCPTRRILLPLCGYSIDKLEEFMHKGFDTFAQEYLTTHPVVNAAEEATIRIDMRNLFLEKQVPQLLEDLHTAWTNRRLTDVNRVLG
jgi:hypothetical protein